MWNTRAVSITLTGPYLYIDSDDTYVFAQTPYGLRMEIVVDAPPPPEEELIRSPPPYVENR